MVKFLCFSLLLVILLQSCQTIKQSSKYGFNEGYYQSKLFHKKLKSVYVIPGEDSIKVYTTKALSKTSVDTVQSLKIAFPANHKPGNFDNYIFKQNSFDIDILSILFKFRSSVSGFPRQLNTSILNGAIYLGHRSDFYQLKYKKTPLNVLKRSITHYGFSIGGFTGIGASRIDPWVTQNALDIEYDGLVNVSGIALIIALDKLSFAVTLGVDHLLDQNSDVWIYQGKPWWGLGIGLNLN